MTPTKEETARAKWMARRVELRDERDMALREIGEQRAEGIRKVEERAKRQRSEVYASFRAKMETLGQAP